MPLPESQETASRITCQSKIDGPLVVTGVLTDVCVHCTLLSAAARDYRVTAVTDGVATLWPELQQACFAIWRRKFARLRTTAEVIEEIGGMSLL